MTCQFRLCVRDMRRNVPFLRPAAFPPPSPPPMSLDFVRGFFGTMQPSDSSCLPAGLRFVKLPRLARDRSCGCGRHEASQVPYKGRLHVHEVYDCARSVPHLPSSRMERCCLLFNGTRSAPRNSTRFAAQYSAHGLPCERFAAGLTTRTSRITRGRSRWLDVTP